MSQQLAGFPFFYSKKTHCLSMDVSAPGRLEFLLEYEENERICKLFSLSPSFKLSIFVQL